jgi:hypothetical protein
VSSRQIKITVSAPWEYPERRMPYVVRWRLNSRGYWRSFATNRGANGAEAFHAKLKVASLNELDWDSRTGFLHPFTFDH